MKQERVECYGCNLEGAVGQMYRLELYDHPFDTEPKIRYVHKKVPTAIKKGDSWMARHESCEEFITESGDFDYFTCDGCYRMVCRQNPSNGWHTQYRDHFGDQLCLKCYEEMILENGMDREGFEENTLGGMFFSGDNHEPLDAGYLVDERVYNKLIRGGSDAKEVCKIALDYIDKGGKVIIGYESMAIGGSEGYVTLFYKLNDSVNGRVD